MTTPNEPRCDGSLQRTLYPASQYARPRCPVCETRTAVVLIDGLPHLVEHLPRRAEALPMSLDLFA